MQEGNNARQQVVERIRQSTSILVAVGNNPSVDALAASLGLTLMLNKLNKHTTAVFSGVIPQAIQFLEPNKSFENNVDALRDFIISLDKEKADRLRYKVEDDVVRIFITPYKTSITDKDLQFSQGDFNVDLIIALGVEKREDLDKAIVAHGRILHDATVVTVNADNQRSTLGAIDWNDAAASSLCEMIVGVSEVFQQPGLLDAQISTALLTGIVANTERFSNPRTSPRVMTMAAQLMAAGANQQLIATNLEKAKEIVAPTPASTGPMAKQEPSSAPAPMPEESGKPKKEPGELDIVHEKDTQKAPAASAPAPAPAPKQVEPTLTEQQEKDLEAALPAAKVQHNLLPELKEDLEAATPEKPEEKESKTPGDKPANDEPVLNDGKKEADGEGDYISSHGSWKGKRLEPPTLGGTLNATAQEAHDDAEKADDAERNKKLLTHPDDALPTKSKRNRNRRGKGGNNGNNDAQGVQVTQAATPAAAATLAATPALPAEPVVAPLPPAPVPVEQAPVVDMPVLPPQPTATPAPEPQPELAPTPALPEPTTASTPEPQQSEPAPAPAPVMPPLPELPPIPASLPPAPTPEPTPLPVTRPTPDLTPEPAIAPMPPMIEPVPAPEPPQLPPEPAVEEAASSAAAEAAAVAQPAQNVVGDLDSAREAVSAALDAQPFSPAGQPLQSVGAQPMVAMPDMPVSEPLTSAALQNLPPAPEPATTPVQTVGDLPPLPPMPPLPPTGTELPPAPDLPGLNAPLPPINEPAPEPQAPQQPPETPPAAADPKQFKIPGA